MKKILSLVLACVLCAAAMPVVSFADIQATANIFGVITDAEGNIVEVLPMPRTTYVDSVYTLSPGGKFTSYQYEPSENFFFGFFSTDKNGVKITANGSRLEETVEVSNVVGGDGRKVLSTKTCTVTANQTRYFLNPDNVKNSGYKYYNGILENKSSYSVSVRIVVGMDGIVPL